MYRRSLQIVSAVLGLIPIVTGLTGMTGIHDPLYAAAHLAPDVFLDSNLRFFGGVWLGLGVAMWWIVPTIEKQTLAFRILWGMIFAGGMGRLLSMVALGVPPVPFVGFTVLEIVGAPLMVLWQKSVAKGSVASSGT